MLQPVTDWKSAPKLDPRFGYYFQKNSQAWGWIGSQCSDVTKTQHALQQHVGWLQRLESFMIGAKDELYGDSGRDVQISRSFITFQSHAVVWLRALKRTPFFRNFPKSRALCETQD